MPEVQTCVLVVDDDDGIRALIARVLGRAGYLVAETNDGAAAIELLRQMSFHAVVLDLMMPHTNGFDVIAFIKEQLPGQRHVIVISAAADRMIDSVDETVVCAKLRKPFDLQALLAAVERCRTSRI